MAVEIAAFVERRREWLAAVDARRQHVDDCLSCLVEWLPNCGESEALRQAADRALERTGTQPRLTIVPLPLDEANQFVRIHHRHHRPTVGHKFSLGVADEDGAIRGVAIVGRPVARMLDNGLTLEVNRVATDGCPNACSALYGAAWRAAKALGYRRLITYTLNTEPGTSLCGAGWKLVGERGGGSWSSESRPRVDKHPLQLKLLWEATA